MTILSSRGGGGGGVLVLVEASSSSSSSGMETAATLAPIVVRVPPPATAAAEDDDDDEVNEDNSDTDEEDALEDEEQHDDQDDNEADEADDWEGDYADACVELDEEGVCFRLDPSLPMMSYLNPAYMEKETLDQIRFRLREKHLVILKDAFLPEFAEAMHKTFENATNKNLWELYTEAHDDGFHYHHHNIYNQENWDPLFLQAQDMFYHQETKDFIHTMTGRDTSAGPDCSPSYYMPGDFSLPHEDMFGQRTVGFVWHLSKDWRPEYGGALVWLPERKGPKVSHASFNTLYLFDVNSKSDHFVSAVVNDESLPARRYTFNGWWGDTWEPQSYEDTRMDDALSTRVDRTHLTATQSDAILRILFEEIDPERDHEIVESTRYQLLLRLWDLYAEEHRNAATEKIAVFESDTFALPPEEEYDEEGDDDDEEEDEATH